MRTTWRRVDPEEAAELVSSGKVMLGRDRDAWEDRLVEDKLRAGETCMILAGYAVRIGSYEETQKTIDEGG